VSAAPVSRQLSHVRPPVGRRKESATEVIREKIDRLALRTGLPRKHAVEQQRPDDISQMAMVARFCVAFLGEAVEDAGQLVWAGEAGVEACRIQPVTALDQAAQDD
jgi:hypothetical protein